ncbi:MAG TPA: CHASE sensor domain-containing protein [Candidatus Binatia bacterium]|nr:CHASE sensor domain-containing protein [Candidatus Binatia bacterium]
MFRNLSIKRKQMLIITLTSTVALLLASSAFIYYELITFRSSAKENLSSLADILSYNSTAALTFNDSSVARDLLNCLSSEPHIMQAVIYNKNAQLFARYTRKQDGRDAQLPTLPPEGFAFGENSMAYGEKIQMQGEQLGWIYLKTDLTPLAQRVQQYISIVLLVSLASLLAALLISTRLQRVVSDPILKLARLARMVSFEKNYSVRASPPKSRDEVGELIAGFNEMLEQIQSRDAALQSARDDLERRVHERTQALQQEVSERRRAEQQLQQQLTRISLLNSITRAITDRQDLESVVNVVLKQLQDNLPIDFGRVYLYDKQARTITVAGANEAEALDADTHIFTRQTAIESSGLTDCLEGKPVIWADMQGGEWPLQERLTKAELRSAIAVPLVVEGELFGILLAARKKPQAFSSGECEFLRMLSEHVALAAHQARLHTQLQSAYDELRQTQQAVMQQERLRALGQMASGIAHDINNALCPIVVYTDMLLQKSRSLEDETCKYLNNIKTAGEDISHIVSRMREFYRRRDGKDALAAISLNRVAQQVIELTRPRWRDIPQARGITVEMELDLDEKVPEIPGIESELREAITNLILNAVDAMPNGGRLILRSRSRAGAGKKPAFALLEVRDNGTGMSDEVRRRCLEPFFSTKGKRGTGLGLAMVYGIMERHDGRIEIDSSYGKGTTMRLVFPVRDLPSASPQKPERPPKPLPAMRILCVDDEPLLREMMKQILESGGHTVELADGGESGLATFRAARQKNEPFDVVITDLGMPYLDGRQLSRALKNDSPDTPIIMLTGWGTIMKEDGDMPAQVDGVLSKPPKIAELYAMLGKVTREANAKAA